jgi:hypothetical protein
MMSTAELLVLAALASQSPEAPATFDEAAASGRRLQLVWRDDHNLVSPLLPGIERETRALFGSVGIRVDWRVGAANDEPHAEEISVLLLSEPQGDHLPRGAMGAVRRNAATRVARVFLAPLEGLLRVGSQARLGLSGARGQKLARAIARVSAHEVVHVLVPDLGHTNEGLMQASWDRAVLANDRVRLDREATKALQARFDTRTTVAQCPAEKPASDRYVSDDPSSSCTRSL